VKSSLLTKAALCICPPTVVATTVASVPPVRRAVHHLTQPAHPTRAATPAAPPCAPVTRRTLASPLPTTLTPDEVPVFTAITPGPDGFTPQAPITPPTFPGGGGVVPNNPGGSNTPAVPEPAAWVMMVLGFGLVGAGIRQRHRYVLRSRTAAFSGGGSATTPMRGFGAILGGGVVSSAAMMSVGAGPVQASAKLAQLGAKALNSSMLAKAALCVCPPVAMAVTTAALPPVRHAVYNATAPKPTPALLHPAIASVARPCVPLDVPTAAEAVQKGGDTLAVFRPTPSWPS